MPARHGHLRRLIKHVGWISVAMGLMVALRALVPVEALAGALDVGGNFLQTFGSIYGVLVAFAMFVVWQQHNDTQAAVEKEAVTLFELYRLVSRLDTWSEREPVVELLRAYAASVLARYGPQRESNPPDRRSMLLKVQDRLLSWQPGTPREERLSELVFDTFHELYEAREHRTTVAGLRLPDGLRWFVYLGGGICVATVALLRVESVPVHAAYVAGMTWVIVAAASIIIDLDDPFSGDFVVDWSRFQAMAKRMDAEEGEAGQG